MTSIAAAVRRWASADYFRATHQIVGTAIGSPSLAKTRRAEPFTKAADAAAEEIDERSPLELLDVKACGEQFAHTRQGK